MSISRNVENDTSKSINDVRNDRRIDASPVKTESNDTDLNVTAFITDCKNLVNKYRDGKIISMSAIDVGNMINIMRPYGLYRSSNVVVVSMSYGILISGPDSEYTINANDTLLSFIMSLVLNHVPEETISGFCDTLAALHTEYQQANSPTYAQ